MRHSLDQLDFFGDHVFTLGLPEEAPLRFKKMVFAAAKAYFLNEPTEAILKEFGATWTQFHGRQSAPNFEMAMLCLKAGYWLEASSMIKQVIEQISWVYAIRAASYEKFQPT